MNVAIIGAGFIGRKRAAALSDKIKLKVICDINIELAQKVAADFGCDFTADWHEIVQNNDIEAVFVTTSNNFLAEIGAACIAKGKHVLIEKPGARNPDEMQQLLIAHKSNPVVVRFGYNHRYHPSIIKAKEIISRGAFGQIMFMRAKYGHGGRVGYDKEWRFQPEISGGGELLDQGSHLIDLSNYFLGEMTEIQGMLGNLFWSKTLEDTAFWTMRNPKGQMAQFSATCIEWKNVFQFEIMLEKAKIQINGLGRSYGRETLTIYKMKPEMGPPEVEEIDFHEEEDFSWRRENNDFFQDILLKDYSDKAIRGANYVLKSIYQLYDKKYK